MHKIYSPGSNAAFIVSFVALEYIVVVLISECLVLLHKTTNNGNARYYSIETIPTLFNKFIVERVYGNIRFQACTGKRCNEFLHYDEALSLLNKIKDKKRLYPKKITKKFLLIQNLEHSLLNLFLSNKF
ncbi:hypothetical protein [Campylobacter sp. B0100352/1]|uniref:hypothetical protein n=1 Tax=Campylobacter sp. B0100352/1 TaxID=2735783 RepID=UPI00301D6225